MAAILKMAFEVIPRDPADRIFFQGNTLGPSYRHWHRGKFFDGRYRLFFRFSTSAKAIVLAWVNDEETLRTYRLKTDAYAVFKGMLGKNRPPDDWDTLLREAQGAVARSKIPLRCYTMRASNKPLSARKSYFALYATTSPAVI